LNLMETLPLVVYGRAHVLFMLFVYVCVYYLVSNTYCVVFFYFDCLRLVYPMFPVSLDCSFLIVPSVFSNVYLYCLYIVGTHVCWWYFRVGLQTFTDTQYITIWTERSLRPLKHVLKNYLMPQYSPFPLYVLCQIWRNSEIKDNFFPPPPTR
jgi:hypothetical protein